MEANRPTPSLSELDIADPPAAWETLGFAVADRDMVLGGVRIHLGAPGTNITAWGIRDITPTDAIDDLNTNPPPSSLPPFASHPNGATGIDHVVIVTPDFDRTAAALEQAGMPLKRIRHVGDRGDSAAFRQGFRRLGPAILELVEAKQMPAGPAAFYGLVIIVEDLDALANRLGDRLRPIKPAVQPGRRIATLDRAAGLSTHLAFMDPES
jgi:hypothetical protein